MNIVNPLLKIRIDNGAVIDVAAEIDEVQGKLRISATDAAVIGAVKSMANARQVAVAIEFGGKRFHTQSFGLNGAREALNKSLRACKLDGTAGG